MSEQANSLIQKYESLKSQRSPYETDWQDIKDYVRPITSNFNRSGPQRSTQNLIYDGTAPDALEQLSAGLHSYLTNPTDRWFELEVDGMHEIANDHDALLWLELVSDIIFRVYSDERVNLNPAMVRG